MKAETLKMSRKEQDRAEVIRQVMDGYIKQKEAAKRLGISTRQVRIRRTPIVCAVRRV